MISLFLVSDAHVGSVPNGAVDIEERSVPGGPTGAFPVRVVRPNGASETLAAIIYMRGGGWTDEEIRMDDRLVPKIATAAQAAVFFVSRRGVCRASGTIATERSYALAKFVAQHGSELNVDSSRIGIIGDSIGGDMTAPLVLLAKQRGFPTFRYQVLLTSDSDRSITGGPWVVRAIVESDTRGILHAA